MVHSLLPPKNGFLYQNQAGVSAEAGYGGVSAKLSLDINILDKTVNENTNIGESLTEVVVGTESVPLPIHLKVVPIVEAMAKTLWDEVDGSSKWKEEASDRCFEALWSL